MTECLLFVDRLGMKAALRRGATKGYQHLSGFQNAWQTPSLPAHRWTHRWSPILG